MSDTTKLVGVTVSNIRGIRMEMLGKLRTKVAEDNAALVERINEMETQLAELEKWAIQRGFEPQR
jgi:hypothetical protein